MDVCNAIQYAHSRGVLHRDLKPGNIMLGKFGETLVVDWGLAKLVENGPELTGSEESRLRPSSNSGSAQTAVGIAVGTPQYMSPEQASGDWAQLGPRSDVYSLGATLYCLLTGKPPFECTSVTDVIAAVRLGQFSPPRAINRWAPAPLEAICLKAMSLKPANRYASPQELAVEVERWIADEPVVAYREAPRERLGRYP